jgi:hypothetical protein
MPPYEDKQSSTHYLGSHNQHLPALDKIESVALVFLFQLEGPVDPVALSCNLCGFVIGVHDFVQDGVI